jgi:predicted metal-dependent phosphoesterase TrpH
MNYFGEERIPLKANLHTHTTQSDGKLEPQEAIDRYAAKG